MMPAFDRFRVVLDACVLFPMLLRDVLLTLANHEFYNPKWSERIHAEWMKNLLVRGQACWPIGDVHAKVERIRRAMDQAFPDALVMRVLEESAAMEPIDAKDRHVAMTALAARADAIVTFNIKDFAATHLAAVFGIEVVHPDRFVLDLVDLNEKRAVAAFKELRQRKQQSKWSVDEMIERARVAGLQQTALWLESEDVRPLL